MNTLLAEGVCDTVKSGVTSPISWLWCLCQRAACLPAAGARSAAPCKDQRCLGMVSPGRQLLTSAERCGRVNTPAPLSSDWDNSGVTYTISKSPLWKGPQVPLYMRVLDTESYLASFSSLSTLPTLYGFFFVFLSCSLPNK